MDIPTIDRKAKSLRARHNNLAELLRQLDADVEALKNSRLAAIKAAVAGVAQRHNDLKAAIEEGKDLFTKPRTIVMHGYRVGMGKQQGKIIIADKNTTVALVEKHFPKKAGVLLKTVKTPIKKALGTLTVAELKKIGCEVTESGDGVVIIPVDNEVEKQVSKMLKALINDDTEEEEAA